MSAAPYSEMPTESRAVHNQNMESNVSYMDYSWGDFETQEDFAEAGFYRSTSGSKERSDYSSPVRNPESPLDESDYVHFEKKTARLASLTDDCSPSMPPTPRIRPTVRPGDNGEHHGLSDPSNNLPPPLLKSLDLPYSERDLTLFKWLLDDVDDLEVAIEYRQLSFEDEMMDRQISFEGKVADAVKMLVRRIDKLIDERIPRGTGVQLTEEEGLTNDATTSPRPVPSSADFTPDDDQSSSSAVAPELSAVEKYIQDWHEGGVVLIENISQHTPAREIYALFQKYGKITYLEFHGPDKSKPHVPTRHAYIHYAEHSQALEARRLLHGFHLQGKTLIVFNISTAVVRGEPGLQYEGSALEILNFNGGSNYASAEADFHQMNVDLLQLDDDLQIPIPAPNPAPGMATYSLKPHLTGKLAAASWRKTDVTAAKTADNESSGQLEDESADDKEDNGEAVFTGRGQWSRLSQVGTFSECDSEKEDGNIYLASEDEDEYGDENVKEKRGVSLPYTESDDEEDLRLYVPVELMEFL